MAREIEHVADQNRRGPCRRDAADALAERDPYAGRLALERPEHQLLTSTKIKTSPVDVGEAVIDQCGHVGGVGDPVRLAGEQSSELLGELAIEVRLACGHNALAQDSISFAGPPNRPDIAFASQRGHDGRSRQPDNLVFARNCQPLDRRARKYVASMAKQPSPSVATNWVARPMVSRMRARQPISSTISRSNASPRCAPGRIPPPGRKSRPHSPGTNASRSPLARMMAYAPAFPNNERRAGEPRTADLGGS